MAAALPIIAAFKVLALHSNAWPILTAAIISGAITIFGETLHYIGMSWIETCESIQNDNEHLHTGSSLNGYRDHNR